MILFYKDLYHLSFFNKHFVIVIVFSYPYANFPIICSHKNQKHKQLQIYKFPNYNKKVNIHSPSFLKLRTMFAEGIDVRSLAKRL